MNNSSKSASGQKKKSRRWTKSSVNILSQERPLEPEHSNRITLILPRQLHQLQKEALIPLLVAHQLQEFLDHLNSNMQRLSEGGKFLHQQRQSAHERKT